MKYRPFMMSTIAQIEIKSEPLRALRQSRNTIEANCKLICYLPGTVIKHVGLMGRSTVYGIKYNNYVCLDSPTKIGF